LSLLDCFFASIDLSTNKHLPNLSEDEGNLEENESSADVESGPGVIKINEIFPKEDTDPANLEASYVVHRTYDDVLLDIDELSHGDEADHAPFVRAAPEKTSAQPPKKFSGDFADEDDLLLDL
jgi:hypothetical protein